MVSFRVVRLPGGVPGAIGNMWTVVYFESLGPERTRLRVVSIGFDADAESQRLRTSLERGNPTVLQRLQDHLE